MDENDSGVDVERLYTKIFLGMSQIDQGGGEKDISNLRQGLTEYKATGHKMMTTSFFFQAEACGKIGQVEQGLNILADARTFLQEKGELLFEAEINRIHGELLLYRNKQGEGDVEVDIHQAEIHFRRAIQVARRQGTKSLELRAVTSLCRLWGEQGRATEACQRLREIYGWFSEGLDTLDLQEARVLMDELEFLSPA
jgi:predicted ATPase